MTPSGLPWCSKFPTDRTTAPLGQPFRGNVQRFIGAMEAGGVVVRVVATRRPLERGYLMHWAWMIARERTDPARVPTFAGVDIDWVAGGVAGAEAMVGKDGYGLAFRPSLTSHHYPDHDGWAWAIDMHVEVKAPTSVRDVAGRLVPVAAVKDLYAIGASYGVHKLESDPPHWSVDGR